MIKRQFILSSFLTDLKQICAFLSSTCKISYKKLLLRKTYINEICYQGKMLSRKNVTKKSVTKAKCYYRQRVTWENVTRQNVTRQNAPKPKQVLYG